MFGYIRRARALVATIRRLEGEVEQLKRSIRECEQRCEVAMERARLETVALDHRMKAEGEKVEEAVTAIFEHVQLSRAAPLMKS